MKSLNLATLLCAAILSSTQAGSIVAPNGYSSTAGPNGLNTLLRGTGAPRTYQMQFSTAALGGLPLGAKITELRFRLDTISDITVFPIDEIHWPDFQVTLAQAVNSVATMSTNFAANMRSPVLVKSGPLTLPALTFSGGDTPNEFASLLVFDAPYVYQGGDLVMLFSHPGSDSADTAYLDAATTQSAGYSTDFGALSATNFTATGGTTAFVTITELVFTYSITQSISRAGTNVIIVGTGALPGDTSHIITSSNINLPMSQWTPIINSQFDSSGTLRCTNAIDPTARAQYFRIALP